MSRLLRVCAVLLLALTIVPAHAQNYPAQTIRIVVPLAPGGIADQLARVLAQGLSTGGATAIVENRTGGGGAVGADVAARAAPDGYTLFVGFHATHAVLPHFEPKPPYDPFADFEPIVFLSTGANVLVVNPQVKANTVSELVALTKSTGGMSYASAGIGTSSHLAGEQFRLGAGANVTHVPYRGQAPANQDVVAGHVDMTFDIVGLAVDNVQAGKLRALAITGPQRSPMLPDVPTMREAGFAGIEGGPWFALYAPAKTPKPVIDWVNRRANEIFKDPAVAKIFTDMGMSLPLGTPENLRAHQKAEFDRWGAVIRNAGIKLN